MKIETLTFNFHKKVYTVSCCWDVLINMKRDFYLNKIEELFQIHPAVALLGPRQCGKTTLAEMYSQKKKDPTITRFDLEDPVDLAQLDNPMIALSNLEGLIIIDEIQRRPDLFPILRVLIDRYKGKQKYLILGSASRDLIKQSSETLAGRIAYLEITPFSTRESKETDTLWLRGGFPLAYLAETDELAFQWIKHYVTTFLERDIPNLGFSIAPSLLRRFWMMITNYHGSILNLSDLGRSLGVSHTNIRHYIDILTGTFMIRELQPWHANIGKRQVKTPKIYFKDSGIYHYLLGIHSRKELLKHPKLGASWEGFALEEIIRIYNVGPEECYFWGVHSQAELDLLIIKDGQKLGFEFKFMDAPKLTRSMKASIEMLELDCLRVIYPGSKTYSLEEDVTVMPLEKIEKLYL